MKLPVLALFPALFVFSCLAGEDDHRDAGRLAAYYKNGEIHVNVLGTPESKPLTTGHSDFKPSWSLTEDKLVFFRRLVNDPEVSKWKTAICIMNADGTGFHQITDGSHTDFNQTWTRDGTNTPIWNRQQPGGKGYRVMAGRIGGKPGEEIAFSGKGYHTWAFTCLKDGRILVGATPPGQKRGYYLMTPNPAGIEAGKPKFERIQCPLGQTGVLDRVSLSKDETRVCFEFQKGFKRSVAGRTLYLADFDIENRTLSNFRAFANAEGKPIWFAYPRWTRDQSEIVYHAGGKLFLYDIERETTRQVSVDEQADYRYPHGEATPK